MSAKFPIAPYITATTTARELAAKHGVPAPRIVNKEGIVPQYENGAIMIDLADIAKLGITAVASITKHEMGHAGACPGFNGISTDAIAAGIAQTLYEKPQLAVLVNMAEDAAINTALEDSEPGYMRAFQIASGISPANVIGPGHGPEDIVKRLGGAASKHERKNIALLAATVGNYTMLQQEYGTYATNALRNYITARRRGDWRQAVNHLSTFLDAVKSAAPKRQQAYRKRIGAGPEKHTQKDDLEVMKRLMHHLPNSGDSPSSLYEATGYDEKRIKAWERRIQRLSPLTKAPEKRLAVMGRRVTRRLVEAGGDMRYVPLPFTIEVEQRRPRTPRLLVLLDRSGSMLTALGGEAAEKGAASLAVALSRTWETTTVFLGSRFRPNIPYVHGELTHAHLQSWPIIDGQAEGEVKLPNALSINDYDGLLMLSDGILSRNATKNAADLFRKVRVMGKQAFFAYAGLNARRSDQHERALKIAGDDRWVITHTDENVLTQRIPVILKRLFVDRVSQ